VFGHVDRQEAVPHTPSVLDQSWLTVPLSGYIGSPQLSHIMQLSPVLSSEPQSQ
jgi:hypothetical protein